LERVRLSRNPGTPEPRNQQTIRTKDNTQGAQEKAAKYLQTPYVRKETN
jgi:hypothetical protein